MLANHRPLRSFDNAFYVYGVWTWICDPSLVGFWTGAKLIYEKRSFPPHCNGSSGALFLPLLAVVTRPVAVVNDDHFVGSSKHLPTILNQLASLLTVDMNLNLLVANI